MAAGTNSANPHYAPVNGGAKLKKNEILQLDLWAKQRDGIFADISWVGILAQNPPPEIERVFSVLATARDGALSFINSRLSEKLTVEGREVDTHVRNIIETNGYGRYLEHRTGHSIDQQSHGSGVNLDAIEFPDSRRLLEGSCFSIEPGIYLEAFGLRTEINAYVENGKAIISGGEPQMQLLTIPD